MTKVHEVIRIINDIRYRCRDAGCSDFDRAARNRLIVSNGLFTTAYQFVEDYLNHAPLSFRLPKWLREDKIYERLGGDEGGENNEEEVIVVGS